MSNSAWPGLWPVRVRLVVPAGPATLRGGAELGVGEKDVLRVFGLDVVAGQGNRCPSIEFLIEDGGERGVGLPGQILRLRDIVAPPPQLDDLPARRDIEHVLGLVGSDVA